MHRHPVSGRLPIDVAKVVLIPVLVLLAGPAGTMTASGRLAGPVHIASTYPVADEADAPVTLSVLVLFDVSQMNETSAAAAFSLLPSTAGKFSWATIGGGACPVSDCAQMEFRPDQPLQHDVRYTARVDRTAKSYAGDPLDRDYWWNFTTRGLVPPPRVVSVEPAAGAKDIRLNATIMVVFDQEMLPGPTAGAFSISPAVPGVTNVSGRNLTWTTGTSLAENRSYTVTIAASAANTFGDRMQVPYVWNFTTGTANPPPSPDHQDAWSSLPPPVADFFRRWWLILAALSLTVSLFAVAGLVARRRGVVEGVYLIYRDGRLVKHYFRKARPTDPDAFSSMLTAVQAFVKDSLPDEQGDLDEFRYGDARYIIHRAQRLLLVAGYRGGNPDELRRALKACAAKVESDAWDLLDEWDGNVSPVVKAADPALAVLMARRY